MSKFSVIVTLDSKHFTSEEAAEEYCDSNIRVLGYFSSYVPGSYYGPACAANVEDTEYYYNNIDITNFVKDNAREVVLAALVRKEQDMKDARDDQRFEEMRDEGF